MKTRHFIKFSALSVSTLMLAACSSNNDYGSAGVGGLYDSTGSGGVGTVQTAGLGQGMRFPGADAGKIDPATGERANTVYFGFDQSSIDNNYQTVIEANADYLRTHPSAKVRLEGHTDPRGSREYNIGLGQRRGNSVQDQMALMGVSESQYEVVSYGKEKLAVPGNSDDDYRLDRRVEIIYENAG